MTEAIDLLGPLLTFLSLELAAIGYLVKEVADEPTESNSITVLSVCYGLAIISSLAYVIIAALGTSCDGLLSVAGLFALLSVGAYGSGLYFLRDTS